MCCRRFKNEQTSRAADFTGLSRPMSSKASEWKRETDESPSEGFSGDEGGKGEDKPQFRSILF